MHLAWDVPYEPGELKAVARKDGEIICETTTRTAGPPATIELAADQTTIAPGHRDLSYVTIRLLDSDGNFHPTADLPITLQLQGPGRILAVGNGDPLSHQSFQAPSIETFNGLALVILGSTEESGEIVLTARSEGLSPGVVKIRSGAKQLPE